MAVKFDQHVNIDAPLEKVWAVVSDSSKWPLWFPNLDQATNIGTLQAGATFQWQDGKEAGTGSVVDVDPAANRLKVVTKLGSHEVTHTFDVDRSGGLFGAGGHDSRLRYTMEYDPPGGFLGDFVAGSNPVDTMKVKHALEKVKDLSEAT